MKNLVCILVVSLLSSFSVISQKTDIEGYYPQSGLYISLSDVDFLKLESYDLWWNDFYEKWEYTKKYFYIYDDDDQLIQKVQQWADGSGFIQKKTYHYDKNKLIEERVSDYNDSTWIISKKILSKTEFYVLSMDESPTKEQVVLFF